LYALVHESSTQANEPNYTLFVEYTFALPKCDINDIRFMEVKPLPWEVGLIRRVQRPIYTSYILQRLVFLSCLNLDLVNSKTTTATTTRCQLCRLYISHVFPAHASGDTGCSIRFLVLFFAAATSKVVMILVSVARTASTLSALSYSER